MFRRHPIVTVLVGISILYALVTAPAVLFGAVGQIVAWAGKGLDGIILALSQL